MVVAMGTGSSGLLGTELQFGKMKVWRWMVVTAAPQCEGT